MITLGQTTTTTIAQGGNGDGSGLGLAVLISLLALAFTVTSWWWLNARFGRIVTHEPYSFAMVSVQEVFRLRLPMVFTNTGARTIVVRSLQCWLPSGNDLLPFRWSATRKTIRPQADDFEDFPAPFVVKPRDSVTKFIEFGAPLPGFRIDKGSYPVRIEMIDSRHDHWRTLLEFDLRVRQTFSLDKFIAYDNLPEAPPSPEQVAAATRKLEDLLHHLQQVAPLPPSEADPKS